MIRLGIYEKAMPGGMTFHEMLCAARDAGFDFMEMSVDESDARQARLDWSESERQTVRRAMEDAGVPISTMCLSGHRKYPLGSHDEATRRRGVEVFHKAVLLAEALGIRLIQLAGYDVYYEEGDADTRRWFADNLAECVAFGAAHGVTMGFETMETPFMDTITKAMEYVRLVDSPYLGVYPDLGNLTNACRLYGGSVAQEIEAGRGHLFAMHVKETVEGVYRDMRFGTGKVDFAPNLKVAREVGVRLFVAECWYDGAEDWHGSLKEVNDFVRGKLGE